MEEIALSMSARISPSVPAFESLVESAAGLGRSLESITLTFASTG
jgi:hypothetical protein